MERKLGIKEVEFVAQDHTSSRWQSWDFGTGGLTSESMFLLKINAGEPQLDLYNI